MSSSSAAVRPVPIMKGNSSGGKNLWGSPPPTPRPLLLPISPSTPSTPNAPVEEGDSPLIRELVLAHLPVVSPQQLALLTMTYFLYITTLVIPTQLLVPVLVPPSVIVGLGARYATSLDYNDVSQYYRRQGEREGGILSQSPHTLSPVSAVPRASK